MAKATKPAAVIGAAALSIAVRLALSHVHAAKTIAAALLGTTLATLAAASVRPAQFSRTVGAASPRIDALPQRVAHRFTRTSAAARSALNPIAIGLTDTGVNGQESQEFLNTTDFAKDRAIDGRFDAESAVGQSAAAALAVERNAGTIRRPRRATQTKREYAPHHQPLKSHGSRIIGFAGNQQPLAHG